MDVAIFPEFTLSNDQPLQQQIHRQLTHWISTGRLPPGLRIPATRTLSDQIGVSRNTIMAVLDQLKAEGFVDSHVGRGSFIAADLPVQGFEKQIAAKNTKTNSPELSDFGVTMDQLVTRHHGKALPFTPGVPDVEHFPQGAWQKIQRRHQRRIALMGYDHDQGYEPLREALATYLTVSRGVRCTKEDILITQGAQQALSLCSQLLLNNGDKILHENPGYNGASHAFLLRSPQLIHVPLKNQVIDVDWIISHHQQTKGAKLLYTSPTHQYPMGGLLSASQRLALLNWSQENNAWVLEDDYDSEFHFLHKPVAAMQGMTANNNVIYMGSFSKTLFPSLRLGYLVLPKSLMTAFTTTKSFMTGESPLMSQAVIADFISEGHFIRHLRRMRQLYRGKWNHFEHCIKMHLGDSVNMIAESAGMHLVLAIQNIDDVALKNQLLQNGFGSSPLSSYYLGTPEKTGLVLGFANTSEQQREALVVLLKKWISNQRDQRY